MKAGHWEQLESIFEQALKLPPERRGSFLDRASGGDAALRAKVDSLLSAYENAPEFFEGLAASVFSAGPVGQNPPLERGPDPYRLVGHTLARYEVREPLGGGGMGVVYKATDTRLQRSVAIKLLPPELSRNEEAKRRFVQEAQAASALDHPNICTIHEIAETEEGQLFIVMSCYEGETLKEKIARGPLPVEEALDYAEQGAEGLAKAHRRDIIHRDVKPANLIVTPEGVVKLVDFGLAKVADVHITRAGTMMGTVAYMSPEQASGADVDHRTDIWSLGVVLYEMLTGRPPFGGEYPQAIIYAILHLDPEPVTELRPEVPEALGDLVARALVKEPGERLSSMAELLEGLRRLRGTAGRSASGSFAPDRPARPREISIAVLPFRDISPGKDNEYFSDGLTEEIITDLSKIGALRVISRTSAMMMKGTQKTIHTIGRELNARYILEGSVRKAGNALRITTQLVDTVSDAPLWAEKYDGQLDDVFDIQERVSRSIADALKLRLTPEEDQQIADRPIPNVHAYECYLRARYEIYRWTEDALERALHYLQNGLSIIGENALFYAGMGYVYWQYVNAGFQVKEEFLERAEACASKAFTLESEAAHGHRLLGLVAIARGQNQQAVRHLKQALARDPNDVDALFWLNFTYAGCGKTSEAAPLVERLLKIDPLSPANHGVPGFHRFLEGRFEEALEETSKMYEMDPENPAVRWLYAQVLAYSQRTEEAFSVINELAADAPEHPFTQMSLLFKYALQGKRAEAAEVMQPEVEAAARGDWQYSWLVAVCHALFGEKEQALEWLENSVDRGFINYPFLAEHDRYLDGLRDEPEFQQLLERIHQEWEAFEA